MTFICLDAELVQGCYDPCTNQYQIPVSPRIVHLIEKENGWMDEILSLRVELDKQNRVRLALLNKMEELVGGPEELVKTVRCLFEEGEC